MLSCPATGMTFISVTRGAPVTCFDIELKSSRCFQHHALDLTGDESIGDHGDKRMGKHEYQCHVPIVVGSRQDVPDSDGGEDACQVAEQVEHAARKAGGFARG